MMQKIYSKLRIPRFLGILFLCSLTLCLCLGNINLTNQLSIAEQPVNAQTSNLRQLVQQGVESYQRGNFTDAIALWEKALIAVLSTV